MESGEECMEVDGSDDVPLQFGDIFRLQPLIFTGRNSVQIRN